KRIIGIEIFPKSVNFSKDNNKLILDPGTSKEIYISIPKYKRNKKSLIPRHSYYRCRSLDEFEVNIDIEPDSEVNFNYLFIVYDSTKQIYNSEENKLTLKDGIYSGDFSIPKLKTDTCYLKIEIHAINVQNKIIINSIILRKT